MGKREREKDKKQGAGVPLSSSSMQPQRPEDLPLGPTSERFYYLPILPHWGPSLYNMDMWGHLRTTLLLSLVTSFQKLLVIVSTVSQSCPQTWECVDRYRATQQNVFAQNSAVFLSEVSRFLVEDLRNVLGRVEKGKFKTSKGHLSFVILDLFFLYS
jgi:hypothetical protein